MSEFTGCPWCTIGTQGCRCAAPCGAEACAWAIDPIPAMRDECHG